MKILSPYPKLKLLNLWKMSLQAMVNLNVNLDFLLKSDLFAYVVLNVEFFQAMAIVTLTLFYTCDILCRSSKSNKTIYILSKTLNLFPRSHFNGFRQSFGDQDVRISIDIHNHQ